MPGYANPQALNRYSYVTNNPLRYTDPTGHIMVEDEGSTKGGLNCNKYPQYCNNGKPKSADELAKMREKHKDNSGDSQTSKDKSCDLSCISKRIKSGPDYGAVQINFPLPYISEITASLVGGTISITGSNGHIYIAPGINFGKSAPLLGIPASGNISGGYLLQPTQASPEQMKPFLTGLAINVSGGGVVGGGVTWGNVGQTNASDFAVEGGIYSPQGGITATYTLVDIDGSPNSVTWLP